ncbi:RNA polymerase sigma factor [Peristeroidobacter soli]|uniref:RNA polymerase sigma factor n=1 Tax=Peristeroidobacter soli TaxID=2497877 RepID=UPI00101DDF7A|nr:sigma-70 family RNA polymerase sigma factor [Peristeroidobacter soli]
MPRANSPPPSDGTFEQLTRRFRPGLMAFFLRRVKNHAEAEDLTQEVFVRLASVDADRLQSADAYVFSMAMNLLRDRSRRHQVRFDHRSSAVAQEDAGVDVLDAQRVAAGQQELSVLTAALRELPERTRSIFILYRMENVDKREIGRAFEISLSSVERELARAMAHVTRRVKDEA